jgi:hypothetical protein
MALIKEQTDQSMLETVQTNELRGPSSRTRVIYLLLGHCWDIYGQMVVYLRLNGGVPPASPWFKGSRRKSAEPFFYPPPHLLNQPVVCSNPVRGAKFFPPKCLRPPVSSFVPMGLQKLRGLAR